jgi:hypothetical protein
MADKVVARYGDMVTVELGERRLYRKVGAGHGSVYVGPGLVDVPLFVAEEEWGLPIGEQPPWDGYDDMTAVEVVARSQGISEEERANVLAYERMHKDRVTVRDGLNAQAQAGLAAAQGETPRFAAGQAAEGGGGGGGTEGGV